MRSCHRAWLILGALANVAIGQHAGDRPHPLVWDKVRGPCPASLDWASLRGKVVVVSVADHGFPGEFGEIAKFEQSFRELPVVFVHVETGSEFLLDQAIKSNQYSGCILIDSQGATGQNLNLLLYTNMVVDQRGLIAGFSQGDLDPETIRAVLDYQPNSLSATPPEPGHLRAEPQIAFPPFYEVRISKAQTGEMRWLDGSVPDRYISTNQPLKLLISTLWETPQGRISFPDSLEAASYNVLARLPAPDSAALLQLVRDGFERHFGLHIDREQRLERVYSLRATKTSSSQLQAAGPADAWMVRGSANSIVGTAQTMPDIARTIEGVLGAPVVDDTGMEGKFNYSASGDLSKPGSAFDMARQLGLELTPVDRPIEILVVRK